MNLIKPKLVDYNLIKFPEKKLTNIQQKIVTQDNSKFYLNLLMVLILCIGGYALYYRMKNKEKERLELEANILFIDEYVNNSLKNIKDNMTSDEISSDDENKKNIILYNEEL
tara:strand:+ start:712 stop:1047 length:336 start_codon:yes stop_codon:yes gene_type:complete